MAILNNSNAISSGGYDINNSLRLRKSASAYLSRTPTVTGSQQKFTLSVWVKLGDFTTGVDSFIWASADNGPAGVNPSFLWKTFSGTYTFIFDLGTGGGLTTTQVFRDPSAWYHVVINADTTQATAADRLKMYVNGNQVTAFSTATYPTQNTNININTSAYPARLGAVLISASTVRFFDGYLAEVNFIDGQALTPSSFGETSTTTGSWIPKKYTGSYGTNGFYLNFSDTSAATAAAIGKDSSGNGNNWTPSGISVTAGTTYDAMIDSPTLTSATVANYAVMNPLWTDGTVVIAQGNLDVSNGNYGGFSTLTIPTNSKFYAEFTVTATQGNQGVGILKAANAYSGVISQANMFGSNSVTYYSVNGNKFVLGGGSTAYGSSWGTIGDVIGIAVDTVNNQITFYKNNTSQGVITGLTSGIEWVFSTGNQTSTGGGAWNFGQQPFSYTPPTGFVRLNTFNLSDSTIVKGNTVMDATTYTGTGASLAITNAGAFKPDFVWVKGRSGATDHALYDSVRGTTIDLVSNSTAAETTQTTGLTAFGTGGFTVGALAKLNTSAATYVGWQWQAGQGTTSSNTSGFITSTVSVNATAGFSVVTYTGTGANATVGHGLGVAPKWVIVKARTQGTGYNWVVYHASVGATQYFGLNTTNAAATASTVWNNTAPTLTVFSLGNDPAINGNTLPFVAYCWAEIAGFSKFGSYTGNSSADGPFVYTGFRPKFILVKNSSATADWILWDSARNTFNVTNSKLSPNTSGAEFTGTTEVGIDFLSNGFKIKGIDAAVNTTSSIYIYMAFAENPFKNSNAF